MANEKVMEVYLWYLTLVTGCRFPDAQKKSRYIFNNQSSFVIRHSSFLDVFFKQIFHFSDFIRTFCKLGGNGSFLKAFENDIF